ncbi:MAG: glycosyl hydrolase, partial [Bacteroidota bacterium]
PLHQVSSNMSGREAVLFKPMPSYRMPSQGGYREPRKGEGENRPGGVLVHFYLKNVDEKSDVKLEFMEMDGHIIKTFSNKAKERNEQLSVKSGGNRFVWDMRYPGFKTFPGMVFYGSPNLGPKAVPGKYKVRLTANAQTQEQEFEILKDPRIKTTAEEFQAQFDFLVKVRDKVSEANQGVIDIRKIKDDLGSLKNKLGNEPQYKELMDAAKKFEDELTILENNIHQTKNKSVQDPLNYGIKMNNRLAHLMTEQGGGDFAPTQQGEQVRQQLTKMVDEEMLKLQRTIQQNTERINGLAKEKGIEVITLKKAAIVN